MKIDVEFQPVGRKVTVEQNVSILDAARAAGVGISTVCGGESGCGSCLVRLTSGAKVSPLNVMEMETLSSVELQNGYRLACQTKIQGNIRIDIPPESLTAPQRTQVEGEELSFDLDPPVTAVELELTEANREDQRSDWERLSDALRSTGTLKPQWNQLTIVRQLPGILRGNDWRLQVALRDKTIVGVSAPETPLLGMAVDIGTTKVAGYLVDMVTGKTLSMHGAMNPQIAFGEDIMARMAYIAKHPSGRDELQGIILETVNKLAIDLCHQANGAQHARDRLKELDPQNIVEVVIVGNTAMHHLFLGLPVGQLGVAPFISAVSGAMDVKTRELGLNLSEGAVVHLLPNIAGFVGGDHVAMLLATDIGLDTGNSIYVDIGTNTEITLTANGRKCSCSTASGPAFEGAHIRDGMRAADGAIERVRISANKIEYQTINNEKPVGICGSGILDAIAQFKKAGFMNFRGALETDHPLVTEGDHGVEVVLVAGEHSRHGQDIILTRKDISEIQLAKGAIRAGIEVLLLEAGLSEMALDQFIIAGAFGSFIDIKSAISIGMFPDLPLNRFRQVGNAAGIGAKLALLSIIKRNEASVIASNTEYVELSNHAEFTDEFAKALRL